MQKNVKACLNVHVFLTDSEALRSSTIAYEVISTEQMPGELSQASEDRRCDHSGISYFESSRSKCQTDREEKYERFYKAILFRGASPS